jgi:hypothetical protein
LILKEIYSLILFTFFVQIGFGQGLSYFRIDDEDGLPSNEVYQISQDHKGFMWIGCEEGLFQYDGFHFTKYRNNTQNGIAVSDIQIDPFDNIWCRNFTGQVYRVQEDSLFTIADVSRKKNSSSVFTLDENGNAWLIADNQLIQYSSNGKILSQYSLNSIQKKFIPLQLLHFKGSIYIANVTSDLVRFDLNTKKLEVVRKGDVSENYNLSLFQHKNKLHVKFQKTLTNNNELFRIDGNKLIKLNSFSTASNERIYSMVSDNSNILWLCTSTGLISYSKDFSSINETNVLFKNNQVSYTYLDREGNQWVSTLQSGIFVVPNRNIILYDEKNTNLKESNLTSISKIDNQLIIFGSSTGLISSLDTPSGKITNFSVEATTVSTKKILSLRDKTYIAHGPLSYYEKGEIKYSFPLFHIRDLCFVDNQIYYVNSNSNGIVKLSELENDPYGFREPVAGRSICYNKGDKSIYLGLNSGLFIEKNKQRSELKWNGKSIVAAAMVSDGNIVYVATISDGLILLKNKKIIKVLNDKNSILSNELKTVHVSPQYIWASSNTFLYRINLKTFETSHFNENQGIYPQEINGITDLNGKLFLATDRGLMTFPEKLNWLNKIRPILQIENITVNGKSIDSDNINLPHDFNGLIFNVRSACIRGGKDALIKYRIIGIGEKWTKQSLANNKLIFSSLPPGDHILQVMVINESGVQSALNQIKLKVFAPFYQRWWFYLLIILSTLLTAGIIFRYQIRFIRKKALLKNQVLLAQLTALKAQMNPHFMYNALNSIQALILQKDIQRSNLYLNKFSKLMRMILDASGKETISIHEETELLRLYLDLEKLRFGDEFSYLVQIDESINQDDLEIPSILLQPFVENALKHGLLHKKGPKSIEIKFQLKNELICTIRDNGIGRIKSQEIKERQSIDHKSFATDAINQRVDIINTTFGKGIRIEIEDLFEDNEAAGTLVILTIPISSLETK